jgi:hypothetical protein
MRADMLARLRHVMSGNFAADASGDDITVTPPATPKKPRVTPVTPVTPKIDEKGKESAEVCAASLVCHLEGRADAIEERAGLAAERVPPVYLDAWARLNCHKPFAVSEAEWRQALDDGGRFLDAWGEEAAAMQWTPGQLFDAAAGLVWRLAGERVEAIGEDRIRLSDGRTIMHRTLAKQVDADREAILR